MNDWFTAFFAYESSIFLGYFFQVLISFFLSFYSNNSQRKVATRLTSQWFFFSKCLRVIITTLWRRSHYFCICWFFFVVAIFLHRNTVYEWVGELNLGNIFWKFFSFLFNSIIDVFRYNVWGGGRLIFSQSVCLFA